MSEPVPKSPHRIKKELITRLHHEMAAARFHYSSDVGEDGLEICYLVMQTANDERDVESSVTLCDQQGGECVVDAIQ